MDIARAYEDGLVDALNIEYILGEHSLDVNYTCEGIKNNITFRFITEHHTHSTSRIPVYTLSLVFTREARAGQRQRLRALPL